VLSGDGGDELFAGYNTYRWLSDIDRVSRLPTWIRRQGIEGLRLVSRVVDSSDRVRQVRRGLSYSLLDREERFLRLHAPLDPDDLALLVPGWGKRVPGLDRLRSFLAGGRRLSTEQAFTRFLFEVNLPADMLRKLDVMSMATSLEVRVPLLDHRIVEFACRLPDELKIRRGVQKVVLRTLAAREIPAEVLRRPKQGFSIPLRVAMTDELFEYALDLAGSPDARVGPLVASTTVCRLVKAVRDPQGGNRSMWSDYTLAHALWFVLQLEMWARTYGVDLSPAAALPGDTRGPVR
jgi:asparagine synthase (glutamine-hydrolysing)